MIADKSPYSVLLEASNGNQDGGAPVAAVPVYPRRARLIDESPEWAFRFTSQVPR
jgi:hypothetical protein